MVSDEMINELVRQSIQASQQYQQLLGLPHPLQITRAPQLRMNQQGMLELADEPDTHDEWRAMNADFGPEKGPE